MSPVGILFVILRKETLIISFFIIFLRVGQRINRGILVKCRAGRIQHFLPSINAYVGGFMKEYAMKFGKRLLVRGILIGSLLLAYRPLFAQWGPVTSLDWIYNDHDLSSVHFISPTEGWAVGEKSDLFERLGMILQYSNGSWKEVILPDNDIWRLNCIYFPSPQEGWAVGIGWNGGVAGVLLHYFKGSWTSVTAPYVSWDWHLRGVHFPSPCEGWAVGWDFANRRGALLHYSNGLWTAIVPPYVSPQWMLNSVHFTSMDDGWAVGYDLTNRKAILLHYLNGEWSALVPPNTNLELKDVYFTSPSEGWAVGGDSNRLGCMLHYENCSWTIVNLPDVSSDWHLYGVHFISPTEGWAVGKDYANSRGVILYYWNGHWKAIPTEKGNQGYAWYLSSVHFPSPTKGWAVGEGLEYLELPYPWGGSWSSRGVVVKYDSDGTEWIFTHTPSGPDRGYSNGESHTYSAESYSNLYHDVEILFDWGDGTNSGWLPVGKYNASKSWALPGSYSVKAQGRCAQHTSIVSSWSGTLLVNIIDKTPPTPNPMTWETPPHQTGINSVSMVPTTADDPTPPISYYFDFVSSPTGGLGGKDSGWQAGTSYTNSNLRANHRYGYRVKAKDGLNNETKYSTPTRYAYTSIQAPTGITFGALTPTSIQVRSTNTPTGLSWGSSGLWIENTVDPTNNSGWKRDNTLWTSKSLKPNTNYSFRAKARNGDGIEIAYGPPASRYTRANLPGKAPFSDVTRTSIRANWTTNDNAPGTQYFCQNVTTKTDSGWITDTSWNSDNLSCGISYSFRVKAKNQDGIETGWTSLGSQSSTKCVLVVKPNEGETIPSGSSYDIQWEATPEAVSFDLYYSLDNGVSWPLLKKDERNTIYSWTPITTGNKKACFVRVIGYNATRTKKIGSDTSDKPFSIEVVRLTSPNGGPPSLKQGDNTNITWTVNETTQPITKVQLFYTKDGGTTYNSIITLSGAYPPGDDSQSWTIPQVGTTPKTKCKVKVVLKDAEGVIRGSDVSDSFFTIEP